MSIYVAEISGRAIAAFNAEDDIAAQAFAEDEDFRSEISVLKIEGNSLWNGTDEIFVRLASPEEQELFLTSQQQAAREGVFESADEVWVIFLVPVSDPTTDDDGDPSPDMRKVIDDLVAENPDARRAYDAMIGRGRSKKFARGEIARALLGSLWEASKGETNRFESVYAALRDGKTTTELFADWDENASQT